MKRLSTFTFYLNLLFWAWVFILFAYIGIRMSQPIQDPPKPNHSQPLTFEENK